MIVTVNDMQIGFMPEREPIDALFILRALQKVYHAKGEMLYVCFVDLEKAFDRLLRSKLELAMRKRGIP